MTQLGRGYDSRNTVTRRRREAWRADIRPHWKILAAEYLTEHERIVVALRIGIHGEPVPERVVARRLHISTATVSKLLTRALAKCRRVIALEEA